MWACGFCRGVAYRGQAKNYAVLGGSSTVGGLSVLSVMFVLGAGVLMCGFLWCSQVSGQVFRFGFTGRNTCLFPHFYSGFNGSVAS